MPKIVCLLPLDCTVDMELAAECYDDFQSDMMPLIGNDWVLGVANVEHTPCATPNKDSFMSAMTQATQTVTYDNPLQYGEERAGRLMSALTNPEVAAIWVYNGGPLSGKKRQQTQDAMTIMMKVLEKKLKDPSNLPALAKAMKNQKPVIGYCYGTAPMCVLAITGLARPVHGPLGMDMAHYKEYEGEFRALQIKEMAQSITGDLQVVSVPVDMLRSHNDVGDLLLQGRMIGTGFVFVGFLQILLAVLTQCMPSKTHGIPLILVPEALDMGTEPDLLKQLGLLHRSGKINIISIFFGYQVMKPDDGADARLEAIDNAKEFLLNACPGVPMFEGMPIGHSRPNHIAPMGWGTVGYNAGSGSLQLKYHKRPIGGFEMIPGVNAMTMGAPKPKAPEPANGQLPPAQPAATAAAPQHSSQPPPQLAPQVAPRVPSQPPPQVPQVAPRVAAQAPPQVAPQVAQQPKVAHQVAPPAQPTPQPAPTAQPQTTMPPAVAAQVASANGDTSPRQIAQTGTTMWLSPRSVSPPAVVPRSLSPPRQAPQVSYYNVNGQLMSVGAKKSNYPDYLEETKAAAVAQPESPAVGVVPSPTKMAMSSFTCARCKAPLHGPFCAQCGYKNEAPPASAPAMNGHTAPVVRSASPIRLVSPQRRQESPQLNSALSPPVSAQPPQPINVMGSYPPAQTSGSQQTFTSLSMPAPEEIPSVQAVQQAAPTMTAAAVQQTTFATPQKPSVAFGSTISPFKLDSAAFQTPNQTKGALVTYTGSYKPAGGRTYTGAPKATYDSTSSHIGYQGATFTSANTPVPYHPMGSDLGFQGATFTSATTPGQTFTYTGTQYSSKPTNQVTYDGAVTQAQIEAQQAKAPTFTQQSKYSQAQFRAPTYTQGDQFTQFGQYAKPQPRPQQLQNQDPGRVGRFFNGLVARIGAN